MGRERKRSPCLAEPLNIYWFFWDKNINVKLGWLPPPAGLSLVTPELTGWRGSLKLSQKDFFWGWSSQASQWLVQHQGAAVAHFGLRWGALARLLTRNGAGDSPGRRKHIEGREHVFLSLHIFCFLSEANWDFLSHLLAAQLGFSPVINWKICIADKLLW